MSGPSSNGSDGTGRGTGNLRGNDLLDERELKQWVSRRLGAPITQVELDQLHLDDAIFEAKRWFAAKKGVEREVVLQLMGGQVEYDLPDDCDAVYDVSIEASPLDISLIFAPGIIADEKIPYNVFAAPSSVGLYSSFTQALQYVSMAKKVMNADANWIQKPNKKILILPTPQGVLNAIIEYKSTVFNLEQLHERDHDLIKRFAVAFAKRDLGWIRSKYNGYPTAQGMSVLNGAELLASSEKEFEKLEQEIADSGMPMPFVTG